MKRWMRSSVKPGVVSSVVRGSIFCAVQPVSSFSSRMRAVARVFARVELPGGDLVDESARGVAVLLDQQELRIVAGRIGEKRHDRARAGMPHDLELGRRSVGKANGVALKA